MTVLHDIGSGKMDCVALFNRIMFLNVPQRITRHTQLLYVPIVRTNYEANDMTNCCAACGQSLIYVEVPSHLPVSLLLVCCVQYQCDLHSAAASDAATQVTATARAHTNTQQCNALGDAS
ncbi:hypothetical protein ACJJTC_016351 [Scirpophaga incertulas]